MSTSTPGLPTLVFIPGSWHKPTCYRKVIDQLQTQHNIRCASVTLPSTLDNPEATFKDDIDAARAVILSETSQGRDVIVVAHSYGGMVGNSAIKGLNRPRASVSPATTTKTARPDGYVTALILIASGFTITGLSFMDPLFGRPPPSWRVDADSGYAVLVAPPRDFFYHDLPDAEAEYWVDQLTTQGLKALFEGGEHAYAGWRDVPVWYIGTIEDRGLPVVLQRVQVGMARGQGGIVHHVELQSSHSPFLSMPDQVVDVMLDAVAAVGGGMEQGQGHVEKLNASEGTSGSKDKKVQVPVVKWLTISTWLKFGIPLSIGHVLGWGFIGFTRLGGLWRKR